MNIAKATAAFLAAAAVIALGGFAAAWTLKPTPAPHHGDTSAQRDAVALVSANIQEAISYYDLQLNDPPRVLSVRTVTAGEMIDGHRAFPGDTIVLEQVGIATNPYDQSVAPERYRYVVRGIVSPRQWLRSIKTIATRRLTVRGGKA